jgi:hypothetical protein
VQPWDLGAWEDGVSLKFKWIAGKVKKPVIITRKGDRLWFDFKFSNTIKDHIKASFINYKWHGYEEPPVKKWSVKHCPHNWFQILYYTGRDPYGLFNKPLIKYERLDEEANGRYRYKVYLEDTTHTTRHLYEHQAQMIAHMLTRRFSIVAGEMGSGKTLAAIETMEASGIDKWLWVGPRSALASVELEFIKWRSILRPEFCTYSSLNRHLEEWDGSRAYQGVIFDESSRLKNGTTKRSTAAMYLADAVRSEYGDKALIAELSGSPAPKSPLDWYSQSEIVMPGFLHESHVNRLKDRLAVVHERESATGGVYPHLVTWLDDERKCKVCGEYSDHDFHEPTYQVEGDPYHEYAPAGVNEVAKLSGRLDGLVIVKFKRDCMDLPDKIYRIVECEPHKRTLRAAKLITKTATSTIKALTKLRMLSDGFQYTEKEIGRETCGVCNGKKTVNQPNYIGPKKTVKFLKTLDLDWAVEDLDDDEVLDEMIIDPVKYPDYFQWMDIGCPHCNATGEQVVYERATDKVRCPKIDALCDLLDEYSDVGRLVVFGGFTGSIDIICEVIVKQGWDYIRLDGRGWSATFPGNDLDLLQRFQSGDGKVAFVGQPGAAGMGLTLTASPAIVYYSNDFNFESRIQSEDRIHRPGMDYNRGATIIDLIHLPSDQYVLDNLKLKKTLQRMSMGDVQNLYKEYPDE